MAGALVSALPKILGFGLFALVVWASLGVHERILTGAADRRARRMFAGNRRPSPRGEVVRSAPASAAGKRPSDLT